MKGKRESEERSIIQRKACISTSLKQGNMEMIGNRPFNVELPDESGTLQPNLKGNFIMKNIKSKCYTTFFI